MSKINSTPEEADNFAKALAALKQAEHALNEARFRLTLAGVGTYASVKQWNATSTMEKRVAGMHSTLSKKA